MSSGFDLRSDPLKFRSPNQAETLVDLLEWRESQIPERTAYTFLADGDTHEVALTYGTLATRARAVGAHLQERGGKGERALMLYMPGMEFPVGFFGCQYAGSVAVPMYPPFPHRLKQGLQRLETMVKDAGARFALTSREMIGMRDRMIELEPKLRDLEWIVTDEIEESEGEQWMRPALGSDSLAFLQYTSGSTGDPKGVMVSQENVLTNADLMTHGIDDDPDRDSSVTWLPPYHDMGLIQGLLHSVYAGGHTTIMSPLAFLQRPVRWLQAISRYRGTISGGPNFAYELCARKATEKDKAELDLSSWEIAFLGGEPISPGTLDRFVEAFSPCGFRREAFNPGYGLAEATLAVTAGNRADLPVCLSLKSADLESNRVTPVDAGSEGVLTVVGVGRALPDERLLIVDPKTCEPCAAGRVGEIWVQSPSLARGYWGRPEESERIFCGRLADSGDGPFLRTEDLGFLHQGELFITGRIKDLIIMRGRNLYPHDIERTVEASHRALRKGCGVCFAVGDSAEERLVIVQEVSDGELVDLGSVERAIRRAVNENFEIGISELLLVAPQTVPKTSSGKLQRWFCREEFLAGRLRSSMRSAA